MIDHTFLSPAGESDAVEKLCREVAEYGFACAMVNPAEVANAAKVLAGSGKRVGTVINFPLGQSSREAILAEVDCVRELGAKDLDFVIDIRKLKRAAKDKSKREDLANDLECYVSRSKKFPGNRDDVVTKLIIECCYLTREEKILACELAKAANFDFVKTSTGFGCGGATIEDVKLMRETVGANMGVKAAGGIRTLEEAIAMISAGANRIGTSSGVKIIESIKN